MDYGHSSHYSTVEISALFDEVFDDSGLRLQPQRSRIVLPEDSGNVTVYLTQPWIGADDELGRELLRHFIDTFARSKERERRLILAHRAVQIACMSALPYFLESVCRFVKHNGILLVCELSARKLGVVDNVQLGRLVSVDAIGRYLLSSQKVIRL